MRTCVVTRRKLAPSELIRFVLGPDGQIVPDVAQKLPGRGVWVECREETLRRAVDTKAFARALRRRVTADDQLPERVGWLLVRRALDALSLCNKAGLVVTGSVKVNAWIESGADGILLQAVDGSVDGRDRVARKYRAVRASLDLAPIEVSLLTVDQLSLAIGRANVVHAAINTGTVAKSFLAAVERASNFRAVPERISDGLARQTATTTEPSHPTRDTGQV